MINDRKTPNYLAGIFTLFLACLGLINYYFVDKKIEFKFFIYDYPNFYVLSLLILLSVAKAVFILPQKFEQTSDFGVWMIFLSIIMPVQIYGYINTRYPLLFLEACMWLELSFLALIYINKTVKIEFSINSNYGSVFFTGIFLGGLTFLFVQIYTLHELGYIGLNLFDQNIYQLENLYERRLDARIYFADKVALGYYYAICLTVIIPFFLLLSLHLKRWWLIAIPLLSYFSMFIIDGSRSMFFIFFILGSLYFVTVVLPKKLIIPFLMASLLSLFLLSVVTEAFYDSHLFAKLISRVYYARGLTFSVYHDTFLYNSVYLHSTDFGNHIPKFNIEKSFFIGLMRGDGISENWNGGVWPSFFAGFGNGGLLLAGLLVAITLKIFDCVTTVTPQSITFPIIGYVCYAWGEISFETSLLTHGVAGSVLIFILLNDRFKKINEN